MKPIVVIDSTAFDDAGHTSEELTDIWLNKWKQMNEQGLTLIRVKPGTRVTLLGLPEAAVELAESGLKAGVVVADADSGITKEQVEAAGYDLWLIKPGSKVGFLR